MQSSGVEAAIQELQREVKRIQDAITMLRRIQAQRSAQGPSGGGKKRRLSAQAKRRISEAAKKRWAAVRAAKKGNKA